MDFVRASLASMAAIAPCRLPSPEGRSIVCSCRGIFGARASGFMSCCLRRAFAATRRCFFDLAVHRLLAWLFKASLSDEIGGVETYRTNLPQQHPHQRHQHLPHPSSSESPTANSDIQSPRVLQDRSFPSKSSILSVACRQ